MRVRVSVLVALMWAGYPAILSPSLLAQVTSSPYNCSSHTDSADKEESGYPPIILHDIKFDGKITLAESDVDQFISELKQEKWYGDPEWADEIGEKAWSRWSDLGYFEVLVSAEGQVFSVDSAGDHAFLTLHVKEGPKFWLKEIRFRKADVETESDAPSSEGRPTLRRKAVGPADEGLAVSTKPTLAFSNEQLRKLIALQDRDVFSTGKIRQGLDALKRLYGSYGYFDFVATPITELDDAHHTVLLTMEISEGKQFRIGRVQSRGANADLDQALQSAVPSGEIFDNARWTAALKSIAPDLSPERAAMRKDERAGTLDLIVDFRSCQLAAQSKQR